MVTKKIENINYLNILHIYSYKIHICTGLLKND